jgi:hypothetical protein
LKWKVDGSGVGVDVASCTNQCKFENEKSDQEVYDSCLPFLCFDFMSGGSIVEICYGSIV